MCMSQTGSVLNPITIVVYSPLSRGTIMSCLRRSETSWGRSGFDPRPGSRFHCPPIIHVFFHRLSRIKGPRTNRGLILWWNRGISLLSLQISPASRSNLNPPDPQLMTGSMTWIRNGLIALTDLRYYILQNLLTNQSRPFRLPKLHRPTPHQLVQSSPLLHVYNL